MNILDINFRFWFVVLMINIAFIIVNSIALMFVQNEDYKKELMIKFLVITALSPVLYYVTNIFMKIDLISFFKYLWIPSFLYIFLSILYSNFFGFRETKREKIKNTIKKTAFKFVLSVKGGKDMYFTEPYDNFLIYGGANSGKTKSLGHPLTHEYIRNGFAGFWFDYKDKDYTKFIYKSNAVMKDPKSFYYINFVDLDYTYRTNPIKTTVIDSHAELMQVIGDFFAAFKSKDGKEDEWFAGALGILKGVATRFYYDFDYICTIPHILLFCLNNDPITIATFCKKRPESAVYAAMLITAMKSEKTLGSFMSSLQRPIADFASNKKICYVLSGDDFDFNLLDPDEPKILAVSNSYQIESLISPVISAMVSISSRKFTMENKVDFVYFLDEATTFKINNFENMPSVLREYKCSFTFITQSNSKIEKRYDRLDRSSIESNFANQFYGRTKDIKAAKDYTQLFAKIDETRLSYTKGKSSRSSSSSTTMSQQEKDKYFTDFFGKLPSGRFVGTANNSNYQEFDVQFGMFDKRKVSDEELPKVRAVTDWDVENNYTKIILEVQRIAHK